jgi:adenylate cyclase
VCHLYQAEALVRADRFEGSLEDVFDLQDQVATSVAGVIEPALHAAELRRSAARPTTDLTAYDFYLRALAVFYPATKERCSEALRLFERAIGIDRHYGPALASAAFCHMVLDLNGWAEEPEPTRRKAEDLARRALQAAQNDPRILANAASALAYVGEDIGAMMALADRALAINPSYVRGWYLSGVIRLWGGQLDLVIEHIETALRLSPREYLGLPLHVAGMAYFFKGNAVAPVHPRASGAMPAHTEALPRAMPTWDASMKRAK